MGARRFEDLEIWQEASELCKLVRDVTKIGELSKDYRLWRNKMAMKSHDCPCILTFEP